MKRTLREALSAPGIGTNVGASADALIAICLSLVAQPDAGPHTTGVLAFIADTARLLRVIHVAASCGRLVENHYGRSIGAARLVLLARADLTDERITVGRNVMQLAVVQIVHQVVHAFERAKGVRVADSATSVKTDAAALVADELCGYLGLRPDHADLVPAVSKVHEDWCWQKRKLRSKADPTRKAAVFFELLVKLQLQPQSIAALEKCIQRACADDPRAKLDFAPSSPTRGAE